MLSPHLFRWFFLGVLMVPVAGFTQIKVTRLTDSVLLLPQTGYTYTLPRTRLLVDVTISHITLEKGPFSAYAEEVLGMEAIIKKNQERYDIIAVDVQGEPEPDPFQMFSIEKVKPSFLKKGKKADITLTREGFLIGLNSRDGECASLHCKPNIRNFGMESRTLKGDPDMTPAYYLAQPQVKKEGKKSGNSSDSLFVLPMQRPVFKLETKETQLAEQAKEAAANLARIRESRINLASGYQEVGYESATLQFMLAELKKSEEGILQLFTGVRREEVISFTLSYVPESNGYQSIILSYLDPVQGIVKKSAEGVLPISIQVTPGISFPTWKVETQSGKSANTGLAYRIPNMAECSVSVGNSVLFSGILQVNQLGKVARLSPRVKVATFYPETGGIKNIQ